MADKQNNLNNKSRASLENFESEVEGVSMKTLEAGLWWAKNRQKLRIILIIFLIIVAIGSWSYTLYGFGYYLLVGMNADNRMITTLVQSKTVDQNYLNQEQAKNLILSPAGYLPNADKYDLYLSITNPNSRWWAAFDYCFTRPDGEKSCGSDFILPQEKKYLISLAQSFNSAPADLSFSFTDFTWNKINNHLIADWNSYQSERLAMEINNQTFTPASANEVSEKIGLNTLSFNIANNSAYSYYEVPLTIILTSGGGQIVYLDRYTLNDFTSFASRDIQITWPGAIGDVSGINIAPDVNILDQGVYEPPQ
ncbi:MAG TPA: hypothetical protein VMC41_04165 [Candidatus Nanoarchaeia archaeon]|nr:hypothetical protein [Candidatus Nanoarchaeia archaeon]